MSDVEAGITGQQTAPRGIKIICVLFGFVGFLTFFDVGMVGVTDSVLQLHFFALSIAFLVSLYGLLTLELWGWVGSIVFFSCGTVFTSMLAGTIIQAVLVLLVGGALLAYIWRQYPLYER